MTVTNKKRSKIYLVTFSVLVIAAVLFFLRPPGAEKRKADLQESQVKESRQIPMISIRQDSLLNLFNYFTTQLNSSYSFTVSGKKFFLHLSRFSSTPSEFYCNNSSLPGITDQGFQIKVNTGNGEIDAFFTREEIKGVSYVSLPTDVMCGLMNHHPNIR